MKRKRFLPTQRLSILAALVVALAAVGLTAFVASAGADFTLSTGALQLQNGSTTGTPPSSGSWVELLNKTPGGAPFLNPASTAANDLYTLINGSGAVGLLLGKAQPNGGIFGPLTYFGQQIVTDLFSALTLPGSAPTLTFSGSETAKGARALLAGNLLGLDIQYNGGLYNVQTEFNTIKDTFLPLRGLIVGNALATGKSAPTILLHWATGLLEEGFNAYNALFHWVGTYIP
jgi:hypothetical protein